MRGRELEKAVLSEIRRHGLEKRSFSVALSGGPDSTALLLVMVRLREQARSPIGDLRALHVNHHLRGHESNRDERFCRSLCERLQVPLEVHSIDGKTFGHRGIEERARAVRQAIYARHVAAFQRVVCLGHTVDDLVENFFLRLSRGASPQGVLGMRVWSAPFFRPLLSVSKEEAVSYVRLRGETFCVDRTNASLRFDRNYIRHAVLLPLKKRWPKGYGAIRRFLDILSEENDALDRLCEKRLARRVEEKEGVVVLHFEKPRPSPFDEALFGRLLSLFLARWAPVPREELRNRMGQSKVAAIKRAVFGGGSRRFRFSQEVILEASYGRLTVRRLVCARKIPPPIVIRRLEGVLPRRFRWGDFVVTVERLRALRSAEGLSEVLARERSKGTYYLDFGRIRFPIVIRNYRPGDVFCPFGLKGRSKKVSECLRDRKVPRWDRQRVAVIEDKDRILLVHPLDVNYMVRLPERRGISKNSSALKVQILESPLKN